MKLRKLHIEDYKVLKDFDIGFVDTDDNPLPIVVLAGVNGSGKTTLLECLNVEVDADIDIFTNNGSINLESLNDEFYVGYQNIVNEYEKDLITLPIDTDNILNIKETIRKKYIDRAFEIDKPSKALKELQDYIEKIFKGLDLTFNLSSIDYNKDIVLFKDNHGVEFDINELSTGEQTLLSKVLYLFFENYKDKVILIDEPELSLHPSWQNKVLKIYENFAKLNNCQIIIATHSPHIIGSAKNEYLRFLVKKDNKIIVNKLNASPLDRDTNTLIKTLMGAEYIPMELQELRKEYKILFDKEEEDSKEGKELEKKILEWESPNSSFWQGLAFDKELRDL